MLSPAKTFAPPAIESVPAWVSANPHSSGPSRSLPLVRLSQRAISPASLTALQGDASIRPSGCGTPFVIVVGAVWAARNQVRKRSFFAVKRRIIRNLGMKARVLLWGAVLGLLFLGSSAAQDAAHEARALLVSDRRLDLAMLSVAAPEAGLALRKEAAEVHLEVTAVDERGRAVTDLTPGQLTILDDGKPVTTITDFRREADLPLEIGVVIDASDSTARQFAREKAAAIGLIRDVMRPQSDRAFVEGFGTRVALVQGVTGDRDRLVRAIEKLPPLGLTSLYDALLVACGERFADSGAAAPRRALVLLSDGEDSYSMHGLGDAILAAQQAGVTIYALTFHRAREVSRGDRVLARLAQATGGRYFVISRPAQLQNAFTKIGSELRSHYSISYALTAGQRDGRYHQLQVQASGKVKIHTRSGYQAPEQ